MSNLKHAVEKYNSSLEKINPHYHALLGKLPGVIKHPTRNGFCYARIADNENELITVFNDKVGLVYNLPIIIERKNNTWYVLGRDTERYKDWGTDSPFLPNHARQHEFDRESNVGADAVHIFPDQFMPALVYPSETGTSGFMVAPYLLKRGDDFVYTGNTGTGNILQYKPMNSGTYIGLVYLDSDTGNPGFLINSGTPVYTPITTLTQIPPYLPYPSQGQIPLYGFSITSGTTALGWENLYNIRQFISSGGDLVEHTHSDSSDGGTTLQVDIDIYRFGFVTEYDGSQQTTGTFDGVNTFTLTPLNTTWDYYRNGLKHAITGAKSVTLSATPPAAKGHYYIYIDSTDGTLVSSTSPWTLEDTKVPVYSIAWDNNLTPKFWLSDERHSVAIDRRFHFEHHFTDGTEVATNATISGQSVAPAVPTDADNKYSISQAVIVDEDIKHILPALIEPTGTVLGYTDFYQVTGSTSWNWEASDLPYRYTTGSYIQYNNNGTMTTGQGNKFYNTYLLLTNFGGSARFSHLHGNSEFSTLVLAQSEQFSSLTKSGLPIDEYVAVYQFTWETSAAYSTKGKARLAANPKSISVSASGVGALGSIDHNSTSGLQGGSTGEYYHLSATQLTDLTDGGETTLHTHAGEVTNGDSHDHTGGDGAALNFASILIAFGNSAQVPGAATPTTHYMQIGYTGTNASLLAVPLPAGTLKNFSVRILAASQPATGSLVFTVQKNNSDTAITATIPAGGGGTVSDTVNEVSFAAGDTIRVKVVNNATSASGGIAAISIQHENNVYP